MDALVKRYARDLAISLISPLYLVENLERFSLEKLVCSRDFLVGFYPMFNLSSSQFTTTFHPFYLIDKDLNFSYCLTSRKGLCVGKILEWACTHFPSAGLHWYFHILLHATDMSGAVNIFSQDMNSRLEMAIYSFCFPTGLVF